MNLIYVIMKKNYLLKVLVLCWTLFVCTIARAESDKDEPSNTKSEAAQISNDDLPKQVNKLLSLLPKFSGYIQTGYN